MQPKARISKESKKQAKQAHETFSMCFFCLFFGTLPNAHKSIGEL
jgi:hypothetical protein